MEIAVICFTTFGYKLMKKLKSDEFNFILYSKSESLKNLEDVREVKTSIIEWSKEQFNKKRGLLFIGATGIAIRAIAPFVKDKLTDSPVLVMDDKGHYIIPLLSGHVGLANELAVKISDICGAIPVITTSTDIHNKLAVDKWALKNNLRIINRDGIAKISSKILRDESLNFYISDNENIDMDSYNEFKKNNGNQIKLIIGKENLEKIIDVAIDEEDIKADLYLKPKKYAVGIGCKKGTKVEKIEALVFKCLDEAGVSIKDVSAITSIDIKKDEEGIKKFCKKNNLKFITFSKEELLKQTGDFNESEFVLEQVGVGNVCERAAMAYWKDEKKIVFPKNSKDGVTVAISKGRWRIDFYE